MDFRNASDLMCQGKVTQDEIITQILNLPCIYGIFQDSEELFSLEVVNECSGDEIQVPLLYSSLEIAMEAVKKFKTPKTWYIAQWTEIDSALDVCKKLASEGVAFDSLPEGADLKGLVIDNSSLDELIGLMK